MTEFYSFMLGFFGAFLVDWVVGAYEERQLKKEIEKDKAKV